MRHWRYIIFVFYIAKSHTIRLGDGDAKLLSLHQPIHLEGSSRLRSYELQSASEEEPRPAENKLLEIRVRLTSETIITEQLSKINLSHNYYEHKISIYF